MATEMKRNLTHLSQALIVALSLFSLTGCIETVSAVGGGAYMTTQYIVSRAVNKTLTYDLGRIKEALLVALCRMEIEVDRARLIEDGEEILATADELEITIELREVTPSVTRISVIAEKNILSRDKATAHEILQQTDETADRLFGKREKTSFHSAFLTGDRSEPISISSHPEKSS